MSPLYLPASFRVNTEALPFPNRSSSPDPNPNPSPNQAMTGKPSIMAYLGAPDDESEVAL